MVTRQPSISTIPIINGYSIGKTESCYVDTIHVYTISRMNGYWIVLLIDGYDRPKTKCHGTAKHCHGTGNHFATINCCEKIFTIGNNSVSVDRLQMWC